MINTGRGLAGDWGVRDSSIEYLLVLTVSCRVSNCLRTGLVRLTIQGLGLGLVKMFGVHGACIRYSCS